MDKSASNVSSTQCCFDTHKPKLWFRQFIGIDLGGRYSTAMTRSEKINLAATIGGPVLVAAVIGWVAWSFNAKMDLMMAAEDKKNSEMFVSKVWFERSHDETTSKLESIANQVGNVKEDVATIKGELSVNKKN